MWIAIDPSLRNTGWAIMNESGVCRVGLIQTTKGSTPAYHDNFIRCTHLFRGLQAPIAEEMPQRVYCEAMVGSKSATAVSAMAMSQAVVASVSQEWRLPVHLILPRMVKKLVCGDSSASKEDIKARVIEMYPDAERLVSEAVGRAKARQEHIYDAIAIGWAANETLKEGNQ